MFVIYGTAVDGRGPKVIAGIAIGLTVTLDILFGGPFTGAAMNPARPRLVPLSRAIIGIINGFTGRGLCWEPPWVELFTEDF